MKRWYALPACAMTFVAFGGCGLWSHSKQAQVPAPAPTVPPASPEIQRLAAHFQEQGIISAPDYIRLRSISTSANHSQLSDADYAFLVSQSNAAVNNAHGPMIFYYV